MVESKDIIGDVLGPFGRFQLRAILLIFLVKIPCSWFMACIIFTAPIPQYGEVFCKAPLPIDSKQSNDYCHVVQDFSGNVYNDTIDNKNVLILSNNKSTNTVPCESFGFNSEFQSIITQFDLVCSREILVALTQSFHLFGILCGGIVGTFMLKYISPRRVLLIGMITQILCGNLTGFATIFELHVFFRCLSAACCALMLTGGSTIFADITAGKYKVITVCMFEQFWSIGLILLPGVASFWNNWTQVYMAISFPTIALIALLYWIPDSPRWLISHNEISKANEILTEASIMNNTIKPYDLDKQLQIQAEIMKKMPSEPSWWSLWSSPSTIKDLLVCHFASSVYMILHYGLLLNIRVFGRDYLQFNTMLIGLCEIIGTFIGLLLIMHTTRKWLWTSIFNIIASIVGLSALLIPSTVTEMERVILLMVTSMTAKMAGSTTLAILATSVSEFVTTEKKKLCSYSTTVCTRTVVMIAPFIGATAVISQLIPQTTMAILSIIASLCMAFLTSPRTIQKPATISSEIHDTNFVMTKLGDVKTPV
ncbi:unnamed protein product [Diamesa serratosioi]